MGVAYGEVFAWVGRTLAKIFALRWGVGDRVRLWTDHWCGDSPLQLTFPSMYGIASNKEASVASSLEQLGIEEQKSWDVHFIRRPND